MRKRVLSLITAALCVVSLVGCGKAAAPEMSAAVRDASTVDGTVWFDDEAVALAGSVMSQAADARSQELNAIAHASMDLVNAVRAQQGLGALAWDVNLEACAMVRATEIVTTFSHTRPNGTSWWTVNSDLMWGENLAKGYNSAEEVVTAWMKSPTHAANILTPDYKTCSIAIYEVNGTLYFAQEFGY